MKPDFQKRVRELAAQNEARRQDPRFAKTMGFLVAQGFLGFNRPLPAQRTMRIPLRDAIWAGRNVEPRILEVLPAALARLPKHFVEPVKPKDEERKLLEMADRLRGGKEGEAVLGIPFERYRVWMDIPLSDGRTRTDGERKRMKTFRIHPDALRRLAELAHERDQREVEVLEELILGARRLRD